MQIFIRQLRSSVIVVAVFTLLLGVGYPLLTLAIGQVAFGDKADGSLIHREGVVVGSELIGQAFVAPQYFHPRPSAAGAGYDGSASSGSNLGPLSPDLLTAVDERTAAYRTENGLSASTAVPVDAVTASGSGLDPHISIANARLQATRVATERGLEGGAVDALITANTDGRDLGVLGEPGVNVVELNLALDDLTS
jgi:K+-transporting ATPase ATPase C chain